MRTPEDVKAMLERESSDLSPHHRAALESMRVAPRLVPVASHPGESVVVVAQRGTSVLYWSDIEEGWEFEPLNSVGEISTRGSNQYSLGHVMHQIVGD